MADLGVYNLEQETSSNEEEKKSALDKSAQDEEIPVIIVQTTEEEEDEPPPYNSVSDDPESYYDTISSFMDFNSTMIIEDEPITDIIQEVEEEEEQVKKDEHREEEVEHEEEEEDLLNDMSLEPLERLVKFSRSKLILQRLVIIREIPYILSEIEIQEAVNTALPIIIKLSKDTDDSVKEGLAGELDKIIYFYYQHAPPSEYNRANTFAISKNTFATMMIEFLLDQNTTLASIAQQSIVTVAAELGNDKGNTFYQTLLDQEIYEGVILGLMKIVNNEESIKLKQYDDGGINLAKMVCLMLISALAPVFGSDNCTNKFLPIVESMIQDTMFYVRKEVAAAIGSLSISVTPEVTLDRLLPIYLKLSVDTIWHVRRSCVFALPYLCQVLPRDVKCKIAIEGIDLFKNDVSRNVRNSLADVTGEIISKFLPDNWRELEEFQTDVPIELIDFFLSLCNNTVNNNGQVFKMDTERVHNCAYNFPAVVLTAGIAYWDSHLKETYLNLTKDYQLKVRRAFAYSLHDIAKIIGSERTERDLVQIFALYLMDLDDVKQGILEHLNDFLAVLNTHSRNEYIPILTEVWDGVMSNWHLRNVLANQLVIIARLFNASRVVEHILPLAMRACHDEYSAVRESGVEIFPIILDIVKRTVDEDGASLTDDEEDEEDLVAKEKEEDLVVKEDDAVAKETDYDTTVVAKETAENNENTTVTKDNTEKDNSEKMERKQKYALSLLNHVMGKLDELVKSDSYRVRLVFTQICKSLLDAGIHPADFSSFFLPRLVILSKDHVVNVRISTSKTIRALLLIDGYKQEIESIDYLDSESPKDMLDEILYHLSIDQDLDVYYYIQEFVSIERLEVYVARQKEQETKELEVLNSMLAELPPTPPVHLIISPLLSTSLNDVEEEEEEEIYKQSSSPMDIVDEYDDIEEENIPSGNIAVITTEEEEQVIPLNDIHLDDVVMK